MFDLLRVLEALNSFHSVNGHLNYPRLEIWNVSFLLILNHITKLTAPPA